MIRRAVRAEIACGTNWMGATAALAVFLDVSPRMIRARCREELVGASRMKRDLVEGCWAFLAMVAKRQAAWVERLADDVARRHDRLQFELPFEVAAAAGTLPKPIEFRREVSSAAPANEADATARSA